MPEVLLRESPFSLEVDGRRVSIPLERIIAADSICQTITLTSDREHPSSLPQVLRDLFSLSLDFSYDQHSDGFEVKAVLPFDHEYAFGKEGFIVVQEERDLEIPCKNLEFIGVNKKQKPALELRFNYSPDSVSGNKLSRHPLSPYLSQISPVKLEDERMVIELDKLKLEMIRENERDYFVVNSISIPAYLIEGCPLPISRKDELVKVYFTPCVDPLSELNLFAQEFKDARVEVIEDLGRVALAFTFAPDYQLRKEGDKGIERMVVEEIREEIDPQVMFRLEEDRLSETEPSLYTQLARIGLTPNHYDQLHREFSDAGYQLSLHRVVPRDEVVEIDLDHPYKNQPVLSLNLKGEVPFNTDQLKEELELKFDRFRFSKPGVFAGNQYYLDMEVPSEKPYVARVFFTGTRSKLMGKWFEI